MPRVTFSSFPGMGLAEMMIRLKIRYGSLESEQFLDELYKFIAGEAYLAFGKREPEADIIRNLSPTKNLQEAAANLFAMLHALDDPHHAVIAVMPIPEHGLGAAINDRLRRAAAPC